MLAHYIHQYNKSRQFLKYGGHANPRSDRKILYIIIFVVICSFLYMCYPSIEKKVCNILTKYKKRENLGGFSDYQKHNSVRKSEKFKRDSKRIQHFENKNRLQNKKKSVFEILELAKYYQNGILDRYDVAGRRIEGVKPDATKALKYYNQAVELGHTKSLYDIAAIHQHGCGDYRGDAKSAITIYEYISDNLGTSANGTLNPIGRSAEAEIANIMQNDQSYDYETAPKTNDSLSKLIARFPTMYTSPNTLVYKPGQTTTTNPVDISNILRSGGNVFKPPGSFSRGDYVDDDDDTHTGLNSILNPTTTPPQVGGPGNHIPRLSQGYSDAHNVHDSTLNSAIRNAVHVMENDTDQTYKLPETMKDIRNFIDTYAKNAKRNDAIKVLDSISRGIVPVSHVNKTESEVLNLVWNRIHDPKNQNLRETMKENLVDALADAVEHGKVQCSTGKINRMVDSLNVADADIILRNTAMVNTEITNKIGKIRQDVYDNLSKDDQDLVDSVDDNETAAKFKNTVEHNLKNAVKTEYVDTNIIKQDIADKITNELIEYL